MRASNPPPLPARPLDKSEEQRAWHMPRSRRAPGAPRSREVIVKVTGRAPAGAAPSCGLVRRRLYYLMREHERDYEAVDEQQRPLDYDQARARIKDWTLASRPTEGAAALYVTLSIPAGSDLEVVMQAGAAAASRMWAGHRYLLVLHDDAASGIPHVHAIVHRTPRDMDAPMLRHGPAELIAWRETLAHELTERGIQAQATFGLREQEAERETLRPTLRL